MAQKPYIDHRQIQKWRDECRAILPLEPLIPSEDGFVLTQDDRLAFRFMLQSQARKYSKDGLTPHEAYALMGRIENLPAVEEMAMLMQRDLVKMRKALAALYGAVSTGKMPGNKHIVEAAAILRETET